MTTEDAKNYLALRQIPQLFESLMTGLMYYRPDDHISYLQECLQKLQTDSNDVRWNLFIQQRLKTPLPPITPTPDNGRRLESRDPSFMSERTMPSSLEEKLGSPLPPIGKSWSENTAKAGMPNCPMVIFMGGPGCGKATQSKRLVDRYPGWVHVSIGDSLREEIMQQGSADEKWGMVSTLVQNGEMAPEDVTIELVTSELKKQTNAPGIILEGFPRTLNQIKLYEDLVGRVDMVVIVDCEEKYLQQRLLGRGHDTGRIDDNINAVAARIAFFKENTLPAVKYFDDAGKLVVIDGDRDADEISFDLASLFEAKFYAPSTPIPRPPTGQKPVSPRPGSTRYGRKRPNSARTNDLKIAVPDSGRKDGLAKCPIVLIMGGPGSGKNTYCKQLAQRFPKAVHISMSGILSMDNAPSMESGDLVAPGAALDALLGALKAVDNAEVILLDGYPRNEDQVKDFNTSVGGVNCAIVLDCEEQTMRKNLPDNEVSTKRINAYRDNALAVISHYDDLHKLTVINVEKPEAEVFSELSTFLKSAFDLTDYLEPLAVDCKDLGRVGGLPTCPIITIIGAPGSGHDEQCKRVSEKYGFVHQPVAEDDVVSSLVVKHQTAKGIILESYPRNRHQLEEFISNIGGMDGAIVIDVTEEYAQSNAGSLSSLIDAYKTNTLPVLGYFDDKQRLKCVKGERSDDDVFADICQAVDATFARPRSAAKGVSYYKARVSDTGRKPGLPSAKIIAVIGAPNGKTDEFCKKALEKIPATIHIQATGLSADALTEQLKSAESAELILLENFPAENAQLEAFNETVGGMSGVILIDSTEEAVRASGVEQEFIDQYKSTTVPMLCNYDDAKKLKVISGELTEEQIFEEFCSAIEIFCVK